VARARHPAVARLGALRVPPVRVMAVCCTHDAARR
jgi:hypothetical protein